MRYKLVFLVLFFLPTFAFSQSSPGADSANKLILNGRDCTDRTFTKVETLPALRVSKEEYADTLGTYLKSHKAFPRNSTVAFRFIVTCHGEIRSIQCKTLNISEVDEFKKAILLYSNFWLPARQNGYIVNSYVTLTMATDKNMLGVEISQ
jgi:hypothetical protein